MIEIGCCYKTVDGRYFSVVEVKRPVCVCYFYELDVWCVVNMRKVMDLDFSPFISGVGYYDRYPIDLNTKSHVTWVSMIYRCYGKFKNKYYKGVIICKEWHNYYKFAEWYDVNYIEGFVLDKDLFSENQKIYSPETCCFLPVAINGSLFAKIHVCSDENGYFFHDTIYTPKAIKRYFKNEESAILARRMYQQAHMRTLINEYWRKLPERTINKLLTLYEE